MVRTGNGGGCNGPRFSEEFALCVYISFRTLRKNTFVIYFHYADTYLCTHLPRIILRFYLILAAPGVKGATPRKILREGETIQNEKKRRKVEGRKYVEKELLKQTLYIFAVKYYKSRK